MSVSMASGVTSGAFKSFTSGKASSATERRSETNAVEEFRKEANKTPADRIKESILKKYNLSQEAFESLPPEQQAGIMREIEQAMRRALKAGEGGNGTAGGNVNVLT